MVNTMLKYLKLEMGLEKSHKRIESEGIIFGARAKKCSQKRMCQMNKRGASMSKG